VGSATIVIPPATVVAEPFIAQSEGFFKRNGVNVTLLTAQGGGNAVKLWVGGQADFAATGTNLPMTLAEQGTQARDLIGLYTKNAFTIVAQPKLHIKNGDTAALKGLKIGIDSAGSPGDIVMRDVLQNAGVPLKDETFIATNSGAPEVAAFEAGVVDAAITSDPATSILLADGKATSVLDLRKGQGPASLDVPQASLAATGSYISAHRGIAVAVVKSMCEAMKFGRANPGKAVADLEKVFPGQSQASLKLSVDATKDGWQANLTRQGVKNLNMLSIQTGSVKNRYDYNQVVDTSFRQYWSGC
jgi:NitT/TauT family transport system substrate-binding protein